jgi:hypothetical protein
VSVAFILGDAMENTDEMKNTFYCRTCKHWSAAEEEVKAGDMVQCQHPSCKIKGILREFSFQSGLGGYLLLLIKAEFKGPRRQACIDDCPAC